MDNNNDLFDLDYIENRIQFFINEYIEQDPDNIDPYKSQSQFYGCLSYAFKNVFRATKKNKNNQKSIIDYKDIDFIYSILEYYIELCIKYKRMVTKHGFSKLIGIDESTIYNYINNYYSKSDIYSDGTNKYNNSYYTSEDKKKLSVFWLEVWKKLETESEQSLRNRAFDNGNVTGTLALLNHDHGYNIPGIRERATEDKQLISREQIQQQLPNNAPDMPKIEG